MIHALVAAGGVLLAFVAGWRVGYRRGWHACDFEHDFDRCPHCGEFLDPVEEKRRF